MCSSMFSKPSESRPDLRVEYNCRFEKLKYTSSTFRSLRNVLANVLSVRRTKEIFRNRSHNWCEHQGFALSFTNEQNPMILVFSI